MKRDVDPLLTVDREGTKVLINADVDPSTNRYGWIFTRFNSRRQLPSSERLYPDISHCRWLFKVHTDKRSHISAALSFMTVTHPSTNRDRRHLTLVNKPPRYLWSLLQIPLCVFMSLHVTSVHFRMYWGSFNEITIQHPSHSIPLGSGLACSWLHILFIKKSFLLLFERSVLSYSLFQFNGAYLALLKQPLRGAVDCRQKLSCN